MAVAHILLVNGVERSLLEREGDLDEAGVGRHRFWVCGGIYAAEAATTN